MIDLGFKEKIEALKRRYAGEHPDALKQITEWEERVRQLSLIDDFMRTDAAQGIYKAVRERATNHIKGRLKKGNTLESLKIADARQEECEWLLGLFNSNYRAELESIEKIIDQELA